MTKIADRERERERETSLVHGWGITDFQNHIYKYMNSTEQVIHHLIGSSKQVILPISYEHSLSIHTVCGACFIEGQIAVFS